MYYLQQPLINERGTESIPGQEIVFIGIAYYWRRYPITFYIGKSMLAVRRSLLTRRGMLGAGAANGRRRPAVSVIIELRATQKYAPAFHSEACRELTGAAFPGWRVGRANRHARIPGATETRHQTELERVLSVTSLGLSHELPSDLFRHPARSPKGYDCNGLGHIVLTSSVRASLMKTLLKQWPKMLTSLSTFQQIGRATWPRLPCLL